MRNLILVMTNRLGRMLAAIGLVISLGLTGLPAHAEDSPTIAKPITSASVGIQMFGWNWNALADECTNYLGPNGYDWILTLPPQEHKTGNQWWVHYQPVSYKLESSAGTRAEFAHMVSDCNAAGVKVVTDAVVNHMAGGRGIGFAGTEYENADFSPLFAANDFHSGLAKSDPHYCSTDISNWNAFDERTNCKFPGLPDLATEKSSVRQKITDFLNDQLSLGVSGFRIDAAKHIQPADLKAIKSLLVRDAYFVQEVAGSNTIAQEYLGTGDVWAWDQQQFATDMFSSPGYANLGKSFDAASREYGLGDQALTWVTNHDTDHHGGGVTYNQGKLYQLSFAWILSEPYGKPMLYSGYAFFDENAEAPQNVSGKIEKPYCASSTEVKFNKKIPTESTYDQGDFTCVERWKPLTGMIGWRDAVGDAAKKYVYAKTGVYGFARGTQGYVVFNSNARSFSASKLKTGLPAGTYCDHYSGGKSPIKLAGKTCSGLAVTIAKDGTLTTKLAGLSALAISSASRLK